MERTSIWPLLFASIGVIALAAIILTAPDPRLVRTESPGISEVVHAEVLDVLEQGTSESQQPYSKLRVRATSGSIDGTVLDVEERAVGPTNYLREFRPGDEVLITYTRNPNGTDLAFVAEYVRTPQLAWLALIFAVTLGLVGGFQGLRSLLGMAISFVVILRFIVPHILNGANPVLISVVGALFVLIVTLYLSHGFNAKTTAALAGTVVALLLTGVLGQTFIAWTRLTGLASEEVTFLSNQTGVSLSFEGLLLGGLIIATLGVLDDVAVSQSSVVFELRSANPSLGAAELIRRAMRIGRDHIASTVNTLFLAYAGSSLPLLLLLSTQPEPLGVLLNRERITVELVSALVGSLGLIAAVPLTTAAAAFAVTRGWAGTPPAHTERHATHSH
ncbi:MAG: YibE/F family protein [Dehalococcoidia bacterium]